MAKIKIVTNSNFKLEPRHFRNIPSDSLTQPDQAYTIRELEKRFRSGIYDASIERNAIFPGHVDIDGIDLEKVKDMTQPERAEMAKAFAEKAEELGQKLKAIKDAKAKVRAAELAEELELKAEHRRRKRQEAKKRADQEATRKSENDADERSEAK